MKLDQAVEIMEKLSSNTADGRVTWTGTSGSNMFLAVVGNSIISLQKIPNAIKLSLLTKEGETVDSLAIVNGANSSSKLFQSVFEVAKQSALGIDKRVEEILDTLSK